MVVPLPLLLLLMFKTTVLGVATVLGASSDDEGVDEQVGRTTTVNADTDDDGVDDNSNNKMQALRIAVRKVKTLTLVQLAVVMVLQKKYDQALESPSRILIVRYGSWYVLALVSWYQYPKSISIA